MLHFILTVLLVLGSCTQVAPRRIADESQISEMARNTLGEARDLIRENKFKAAIAKLSELNDDTLNPLEKALKYNLKGVVLFNTNEVDKALLNFEVAEKYAPQNTQIFSQVQLNMASANFKLNQFPELKNRLNKIDPTQLNDTEKKKFAQLSLAYGLKVEGHSTIVSASILLLNEHQTMMDLQGSNLAAPMRDSFLKMSLRDRIKLFEKFDNTNNLAVAYLAQIEAEERYVSGDRSGSKDMIRWLRSEFSDHDEIIKFVKEFELRLDNASRISLNDIGVILPLSGEKSSFGLKALNGIDTGLKIIGASENLKIHTRDSINAPARGAQAVLELIREEKVALIIGGLFPDTARAEYLEARKYGVLYISLSQINLPKEEKNHNLIEVQGSIESQVEALLSENMIRKFGTRIGLIYPDNEGGKAYADEIWRKSLQRNVQITSIASFPKNTHDYREAAQLFLGLKYPRERSEELSLLEDVYTLEKSTIRRVQTLPPVIDFDWVFIASYPHEAISLIPTLGYYDANKIKVVGGPSWLTKTMIKEQKNLGTLYFVGDDPKDINQETVNKFQEIYGKPAGLIEVLALDAMKLGAGALTAAGDVSTRDSFDAKLKEKSLDGLTSQWSYQDGVWIKKMNSMAITRGEVVRLFEAEATP
jgi:ABC-type branched-subunit amino acid transport system substrate-binding protein